MAILCQPLQRLSVIPAERTRDASNIPPVFTTINWAYARNETEMRIRQEHSHGIENEENPRGAENKRQGSWRVGKCIFFLFYTGCCHLAWYLLFIHSFLETEGWNGISVWFERLVFHCIAYVSLLNDSPALLFYAHLPALLVQSLLRCLILSPVLNRAHWYDAIMVLWYWSTGTIWYLITLSSFGPPAWTYHSGALRRVREAPCADDEVFWFYDEEWG